MKLLLLLSTLTLTYWKDIASILSSFLTAAAIITGGLWFLFGRRFLNQVQLDLDCNFFSLSNKVLAEIRISIDNKGLKQFHLTKLDIEVKKYNLGKEMPDENKYGNLTSILEENFSVRQNVRQVITHTIELDPSVVLIQVSIGINNHNGYNYMPMVMKRHFKVAQDAPKQLIQPDIKLSPIGE